jgi:anti-sigma regulatory factor (Ser/Thr protein kinase)
MEALGRNPGRIIAAWRTFVREHAADEAAPLGIGEPVWPQRSDPELVECDRHETLLNLAFGHDTPWTLLCPYDADRLPDDVLAAARRSHSHVHEGGAVCRSEPYARAIPGPSPLPVPAAEATVFGYSGRDDLKPLRELIAHHAEREGLSPARVADIVLAVHELATNTLLYARGGGEARIWREGEALLVEVEDAGHIADPLAGRDLPPPDALGGRGLYLVNQFCDLVQLRSSPEGSVIRLHMRLG